MTGSFVRPLALSIHSDGYMTDPTGELQVHLCDNGSIEIYAGSDFVRVNVCDLPLLIRAARLLLPPEGPSVTPPAAAPDRPLWKAMYAAYERVLQEDAPESGHFYAAELRTVADEIARQFQDRHGVLEMGVRGVVAWLHAEAERAEAP